MCDGRLDYGNDDDDDDTNISSCTPLEDYHLFNVGPIYTYKRLRMPLIVHLASSPSYDPHRVD